MKNWLIYQPPGGARATLEDVETFVTLREGFSRTAFFLAPFWLAWRRCWLALALWAAAIVLVVVVFRLVDIRGGLAPLFLLLPNLAIGLESSWLRARALERRGFVHAGSVMARTREEAEALFFHDWLAERGAEPAETAPAARPAPFQPLAAGVLGLFPDPRGAR